MVTMRKPKLEKFNRWFVVNHQLKNSLFRMKVLQYQNIDFILVLLYTIESKLTHMTIHSSYLVGIWILLLCESLWCMDNLSVPNIMTTLDKCWLILQQFLLEHLLDLQYGARDLSWYKLLAQILQYVLIFTQCSPSAWILGPLSHQGL